MGKGVPHIYISRLFCCPRVSREPLLVSISCHYDGRETSVFIWASLQVRKRERGQRRNEGVVMCTKLFSLFLFALPVLRAWAAMSYKCVKNCQANTCSPVCWDSVRWYRLWRGRESCADLGGKLQGRPCVRCCLAPRGEWLAGGPTAVLTSGFQEPAGQRSFFLH